MYLYFVQDVLNGLDLDLEGYWLDDSCLTGGSYWAGKDISMVARAASISRAFGTDHYLTFDASLRACLDKWIRVDGGCSSYSSYRTFKAYVAVWRSLTYMYGTSYLHY